MQRHADESAPRVRDVALVLGRAERCLTRQIADVLEDVSVECWRVLVVLSDGAGRPMSEIARLAMLSAPSLTRLIDRMVSDNLVHRTADPGDGRRVLVHVAPRGERLREELATRIERIDPAPLGDAGDVDQLLGLLTGLVERMEQRGARTDVPLAG